MQVKLRIQLNGKIPSSLLAPGTNVSCVDKMIPISWSETEATIDADTAKAYSSKVNKPTDHTTLASSSVYCSPPAKIYGCLI